MHRYTEQDVLYILLDVKSFFFALQELLYALATFPGLNMLKHIVNEEDENVIQKPLNSIVPTVKSRRSTFSFQKIP